MRRAILALALGLAFASCALPQEPAHKESTQESEAGDPLLKWKWINFAILVAGLGYLIGKSVPPLFAQRSRDIGQALADAAQARKDAEARASAIEARLAGLQAEIARLRETAHTEMAAEGQRIRTESQRHLEKIQAQASQEIELMSRGAREELRRYSAALALDLAEERLRTRVTPAAQESLVEGFLQDLRHRVQPSVTAL